MLGSVSNIPLGQQPKKNIIYCRQEVIEIKKKKKNCDSILYRFDPRKGRRDR